MIGFSQCIDTIHAAEIFLSAGLIGVVVMIAWRRDTNLWQAFRLLCGWGGAPLSRTEIAAPIAVCAIAAIWAYVEMMPCLNG